MKKGTQGTASLCETRGDQTINAEQSNHFVTKNCMWKDGNHQYPAEREHFEGLH